MSTGIDLVHAAEQFIGEPYSTAPGRTSPTSGHKDCSGLIVAAYELVTGEYLGANVSSTIFAIGIEIPVDDAFGIAGACLLKPENPALGIGAAGHIAFSYGDRMSTVEATPPHVGRYPLHRNAPWSSRACLLPDIDYSNGGHGTPTPQRKVTDQMIYADPQAHVALHMQGNVIAAEFVGDPDEYGIPRSAVTYANETGIPLRAVSGLLLEKFRKADRIALTAPVVTTVPGDCPPGLDTATPRELLDKLGEYISA